jgi:hypothetical protein
MFRGPERRRETVNERFSQAVLTVFLRRANYVSTRALMNDLREFERERLQPRKMSLGFAGDVAVSQAMIDGVVSTQMRSLFFSLVGILLLAALLGRSWLWGLCCVLPCALTVLMDFGAMGFAGIPLGVATSMFAAMTLGVGVDFAIHMMGRYRFVTSRGMPRTPALIDAIEATGPALLIATISLALGFSVLMLSQVPANVRLGEQLVLGMIGCLAATVAVIPALAGIGSPKSPAAPERTWRAGQDKA